MARRTSVSPAGAHELNPPRLCPAANRNITIEAMRRMILVFIECSFFVILSVGAIIAQMSGGRETGRVCQTAGHAMHAFRTAGHPLPSAPGRSASLPDRCPGHGTVGRAVGRVGE